jgi:hypothetical protein
LRLSLQSRQVNLGPAQDALDVLDHVSVDAAALAARFPVPHVELLAYRSPRGNASSLGRPSTIAASRLVFGTRGLDRWDDAVILADGACAYLIHDLDGHALLLEQ